MGPHFVDTATDLHPGRVIAGAYRLDMRIGVGGAAETWRARPIAGGAPVALKIGTHPQGADALLHEAALLHGLRHPNVVAYLGVVELPQDTGPCLLMEWVPGGNLAEWCASHGVCTPTEAAAIGLQLLDALEYLHLRGLVHRDLKPANVLVADAGGIVPHVVLADFGIARQLGVIQACRGGGTRGFTAPEAWVGSTVNSAADLYSLGALLWSLLFGAEPRVVEGAAPEPALLGAAASTLGDPRAAGLARLAMELLRADPGARPTIGQVRVRLADPTRDPRPCPKNAEVTMPIPLTPQRAPRMRAIHVRRRRRRDPRLLPLALTVCLSATVAALLAMLPTYLASG